jgi:hypothetical protein
MGQEILYCYKCQTRLLGSEFEKGKAFKVGGQSSCAACVKDLLASMPEGTKPDPLKASSSSRIPAALSDSTKLKVSLPRTPAPPPPPPAPEKSKNGLIIGLVLGGVALLILIAMAMNSGSGPTARRDPDPPAPSPAPRPGVRPPDPTPAPVPGTPSYAAELREIDEKIKTGLAREEFRSLAELLAAARQRRMTADWLSEIDLRIPQVEARARRSAQPLRDQAIEAHRKGNAAEVKGLRDRIAAWGFPSIVDDFDKALATPVAPPLPPVDPGPADARLVFTDALGPACRNTSWSGIIDFAATAQVFEGRHSIAFTPQQNAAGVYIALDQPVDPAQYPFVTFALYLPEEQTGAAVALYKDWKPEAPVGLDKLGGYPGPRTWKKYVVPVATLNPGPKNVTGFVVQIFKTGTQPLIYLDSIAFLKTAPEGIVPPPPPPPPPSAEPPLVVYDDALAPGWKNWSWSGVWDFAATSPVFEGKCSIAFTPHLESAGIYLHTDQGLDPAEYPFVTFAVYAVEEGVRPGVGIYKNQKTLSTLMLDQIASDLKVREWKRFVLPVEQINPAAEKIDGFQIQAFKAGKDHPLIYIDSVAFLRSASGTAPRPAKTEPAADPELVKLAAQVPIEAAKSIEKWTKGQKVKIEVLNGAGERETVEGAVLAADAVRVSIQRDSGSIDVPVAEIAASSLAEIFRTRADRKPTDAKVAAAFATFEGEGRERPAAEVAARRAFWAAEADFLLPRKRSAAVEKFTAFLASEPAAVVARLRPYVVARLEAAKDTVFLADDLTGAGTFLQMPSSKLDQAWTSTADAAASKARENFVEAEFHAFPGATYRAWIYAGACCLETFEFLLQGSELTAPNPKNSKEPFSCEPGAESALAAKAPSASLKKWHAQHGGVKEPARWEWFPVTLPKYESAGPKKLRVLSAQQGFTVGAIVVSAVRRDTPKEPEIKELEKARFGSRKSANAGPLGFIFHEVWENIDGDTVESLTKHPSFAGKPTTSTPREAFEGPKNFANRYGSRIRGYVHPPVSGNYVFWLATDDNGELYLSLDDTPARKRLVCTSFCVGFRDWTRNPCQKSAPVMLMAGKRYYIEALQKEGGGDDHLSVGWTLPDGTEERPIPGSRLSPMGVTAATAGPPGTVFYRGYNLNGPPTFIDGRRWEGKGAKDLAFSGEGAFENQSVPLTPPVDDAKAAMIRTSAFSPEGTAVKVYQMPAGSYLVYFYVWEDNNDEVYDVFLQGKEVLKGHHSGTAGHWDKLGPYPVVFSDAGTLDFKTNGGHANVSGVEIWKSAK